VHESAAIHHEQAVGLHELHVRHENAQAQRDAARAGE
jgi:hypothetical protein